MTSGEWRVTSKGSELRAVAGYVMAGGASSRFGMDKALAELGGRTMLERMCNLLGELTDNVSVVAPASRYKDSGKRMVVDNWPGQGPLGGIITALMDAHAQNHKETWCLIVGCDMPFLSHEWLGYLVERAFTSGAGAVAPRSTLGLEPLCACWHTRATPKLQFALEDGVRKVTEAMKRIETEVVDEKEWKRFDRKGLLFWNMNIRADYEEARRILATERK